MENFLQEEINLYESEESGSDGEERNIENELDRQILVSKGYEIPITEGLKEMLRICMNLLEVNNPRKPMRFLSFPLLIC